MEEYEYSFKVKDIKPYIEYCISNDYHKEMESIQNRVVYENEYNSKLIARITKTTKDGNDKTIFDVKNFENKENTFQLSQESLPLEVNDENKKIIDSILDVLRFKKSADNLRNRYVYKKDDVTFEIDEYITPSMNVIAIEGNREKVDKIYQEITKKIKN